MKQSISQHDLTHINQSHDGVRSTLATSLEARFYTCAMSSFVSATTSRNVWQRKLALNSCNMTDLSASQGTPRPPAPPNRTRLIWLTGTEGYFKKMNRYDI